MQLMIPDWVCRKKAKEFKLIKEEFNRTKEGWTAVLHEIPA
jgi:hypothetical protein